MTTPSLLKLRYPAFAAVDDPTCAYWLSDAGRIVTASWGPDYEPATLALAAHNMRKAGVVGITDDGELGPGVTSFKSASVSITVSEAAANRAGDAGYSSTQEGAEFAVMLRRNCGMPGLVGCL